MKLPSYLLTILIGLMQSGPGLAANLWQNTVTGMSPQELKTLYPAASGPRVVQGKEIMNMGGVSIFDQKFDVIFDFNSDHLTEVTLIASDNSDKNVFQVRMPLATFMLIRDELTNKYGQPVNSRATEMGNNVYFLNSGTSIELTYVDLSAFDAGGGKGITVTYRSSSGGENPL